MGGGLPALSSFVVPVVSGSFILWLCRGPLWFATGMNVAAVVWFVLSVFILLQFCFSFHDLFLIDSLGFRRGVIGDDVGIGRGASLVASPERSAVVRFILPVDRVRVAYTWMRV